MKSIGKYTILEKIGVGGFGEVFKAHDPFIKRHVAIKTCTSDGADIRQRFFKEAEIAGNLHHRNITTIYDFGVQDDLPYLIQEYLSGEDLDRKIRRKDYLPPQEKLFYLIQIARGLGHAHSRSIIHRDIKPANIRILEDGTAKILDFGIAKLAQEETGLTQAGMTIGTAAYLAPEQVRGEGVDLRTDVFSFGVLAYELLSYQRPFRGEQISAILYKILHDQPQALTTSTTDAPAALLEIVSKCLDKDPARRFTDAGQLSRALEEVQVGSSRAPVEDSIEPAEQETLRLQEPQQPLSQIDLGSYDSPPPTEMVPSRRSSKTFQALLPVLIALLAIAGGWWFGARPQQLASDPPEAADLPPIEVTPTRLSSEVDAQSSSQQAAEIEPQPKQDAPTKPASATAEQLPIAEIEQPDPEPRPPPPPAKTTGLVRFTPLPWSSNVEVSIAGQTRRLATQQTVELPAGSYTAVFALDDQQYTTQVSQNVVVEIGGDVVVGPVIPRPAVVTIRPLPGRPQAAIYIDGEFVKRTPIRRLIYRPGQHQVSIRLDETSESGNSVTREIDFLSNQETVISFDIEASQVEVRHKPVSSNG